MTALSARSSRAALWRWRRLAPVPAVAVLTLLVVAGVAVTTLLELITYATAFLLPAVLLAGIRFRCVGGVLTGLAAGAIGGPAASALSATTMTATHIATTLTLVLVGGAIGLLAGGDVHDPDRERDLNDRERELAQQRGALVQVVSHELRTPLTVIRGGVDTLCAHPEAVAPDYAQLLRATARATRRLEAQLAVVLAASDALGAEQAAGARAVEDDVRVEVDVAVSGEVPDEAVPVVLRELIRDAAASVSNELPRRLVGQLPADAVVVTVEADLWLALRCLLDNAAKFSPDGAPIEVAYVRDDAEVSISVSDHGGGLPAGFSERAAFAPFTPGDTSLVRPHAGLGMGLYTARQLVRRLGGELELDSSVEGVTASIHLPQPIDGDAGRGGGWDDRRRLVG